MDHQPKLEYFVDVLRFILIFCRTAAGEPSDGEISGSLLWTFATWGVGKAKFGYPNKFALLLNVTPLREIYDRSQRIPHGG